MNIINNSALRNDKTTLYSYINKIIIKQNIGGTNIRG
jgi:hypothetical protein